MPKTPSDPESRAFAQYRENQRAPKGMRGVKQGAKQTAPSVVSLAAPAPVSKPPLPLKGRP